MNKLIFPVLISVETEGDNLAEAIGDVSGTYQSNFKTIFNDFPTKAIVFGLQVLIAIVLFVVGSKLIKFLVKLTNKTLEKTGTEVTVRRFLCTLTRTVGYILLISLILGIAGVQASAFATVFSSVTVAIGLAVQGTLSNFAGGLMIMLSKPFRVGDYIIEDTNKNEGTVESIGIVYTKIQTVDNRLVVIPNGTLANSSLVNVTAMDKRRLDLTVGISYGADLKLARTTLDQLMEREDVVLQNEERLSYVVSLDDSAVILGISCWVRTSDYLSAKRKMIEDIKLTFDEKGIEIPFNQMDVHLKS